jgi:hypothetical protein
MTKITWPEIGMASEPGDYQYRLGHVTITLDDLAIWNKHPKAAFTVINVSANPDVRTFVLGKFELRDTSKDSLGED